MITAFLGFLFNRFSFFLIVLAVIVALVFFGKLIWNRFTIGGLVLLALGIGLWTYHDKLIKDDRVATAAPYIKQIKDNNDAAVAKLAAETAKTDAVTKALKEFSTQQEVKDHANIQAITVLNSKLRTTRLRDPGKTGSCSGGTQSPSPGNTQSSAGNTSQGSELLSELASNNLWDFALEADRINVAYIACRSYAYKVREAMIAETDSGGIVLAMSGWTN